MRPRNRLLVAAAILTVTGLSAVVPRATEASFTSHSASHVEIKADRIQNWLHIYSQSTDPDGLTGYATCYGTTVPAATGADETLAVDLGVVGSQTTTFNRVLTLATPGSLPRGGPVTVTVHVLPDPRGLQPVIAIGFSTIGPGGSFTNPITMNTDQKRQLNLQVRARERRTTYQLTMRLTLTYPGFTTAFYQYFVPLTVARN